jgi:hypothetical protein
MVGADSVRRFDTESLDMNSTEILCKKPTSTLWTTSDVARFLSCSERQVYNLRRQGLPFIRVQGMVRFVPRSVQVWLVNQDTYADDAERSSQLADITATGDDDNAECAAADSFREFAPAP